MECRVPSQWGECHIGSSWWTGGASESNREWADVLGWLFARAPLPTPGHRASAGPLLVPGFVFKACKQLGKRLLCGVALAWRHLLGHIGGLGQGAPLGPADRELGAPQHLWSVGMGLLSQQGLDR